MRHKLAVIANCKMSFTKIKNTIKQQETEQRFTAYYEI